MAAGPNLLGPIRLWPTLSTFSPARQPGTALLPISHRRGPFLLLHTPTPFPPMKEDAMTADPIHMLKAAIPTLLTISKTAEHLQVSTKTVRRWIDSGDLVAHRIGRQLRISEPDLQAFIRVRRDA
ncbi:MAG: helix-turn-helix domain-containing protein [Rhodospirillales bacterium]|jgi:excisionase family DNA binding protein|nr:helix-turn-helix domain-containing protein [Rhodospirillales bacterium]